MCGLFAEQLAFSIVEHGLLTIVEATACNETLVGQYDQASCLGSVDVRANLSVVFHPVERGGGVVRGAIPFGCGIHLNIVASRKVNDAVVYRLVGLYVSALQGVVIFRSFRGIAEKQLAIGEADDGLLALLFV